MAKKINFLFSLLIFLSFQSKAQSNLFIDNSFTVEEMIMDFFDHPEITITNIQYTGSQNTVGFFDAEGTNLDVSAGILMTNGYLNEVADANTEGGTSSSNAVNGDVDLDLFSSNQSFDATVIEFDLTLSISDSLNFNYVFASEEYPEFTCTTFNDAFSFFISGPGISGPYSNNAINISTIPNSDLPVTINNISGNTDCVLLEHLQYYIDNMGGTDIIYDGMTTELPAAFYAEAGETYHAKIVIGDVGDGVFDSGVFLSFEGLGSDDLLTPPAEFTTTIDDNAVNFDNLSKYATSWKWDFGNNMTSFTRDPGTVTYGQIGDYTVTLITENFCCTDTFTMQVPITTISAPAIQVTEFFTNPTCFGYTDGTINVVATGGTPPYTIAFTENIFDGIISAGTYGYFVIDANGITTEGEIILTEPDELVINNSWNAPTDNNMNGSITADPIGGTPPYAYLWSNGETTATIENLGPGDYTVEVTDANDCVTTTTINLPGSTSTNNEWLNNQISIFPNPVIDNLFIENNAGLEISSIRVVNVLGQEILIDFVTNNNLMEINQIDQLSNGLYFMEINFGNKESVTKRFVKK